MVKIHLKAYFKIPKKCKASHIHISYLDVLCTKVEGHIRYILIHTNNKFQVKICCTTYRVQDLSSSAYSLMSFLYD